MDFQVYDLPCTSVIRIVYVHETFVHGVECGR